MNKLDMRPEARKLRRLEAAYDFACGMLASRGVHPPTATDCDNCGHVWVGYWTRCPKCGTENP